MSSLSVVTAVKSRWTSLWASATPTTYDNVIYDPVAGTPWVRLTVREGSADQAEIGPRPTLDRHAGIVYAQVFTPLGQGEEKSRWLADKAAAIFKKVDVATTDGMITFGVPYLISVEAGGENWWQTNVLCPYTFDEVT